MVYRVQLLKGIFQPKILSLQLQQAEKISGLKRKTALIFLSSIVIFTFGAWFGLGTEPISKEMTEISSEEFEARKLLFVLGKLLWGFVYPAIILFLPALFFWTFSDDVEFRKFFTVQLYAATILLLEKLLLIPFLVVLGLDRSSSPFSLGVIAQYITSNEWFIHLLGVISIFQIWAIAIQFNLIRPLIDRNPKVVLLLVISINLFFWIISATASYIKIEKLF